MSQSLSELIIYVHPFNSTHLFRNRAKIIIAIGIISPPSWERMSGTTSSENSKGKDEKNSETCAVKSTCHQVRVVSENARAVVSKVVLDEEAGSQLAQDHTRLTLVVRDVTSKLDELSEVDIGDVEILDLGKELEQPSTIRRFLTLFLYSLVIAIMQITLRSASNSVPREHP